MNVRNARARALAALVLLWPVVAAPADPSPFDSRWPAIVVLLQRGAPDGDGAGLRQARDEARQLLELSLEPAQEVQARYGVAYADTFLATVGGDKDESEAVLDDAVAQLQKALTLNPRHAESHVLLAVIFALRVDSPGATPSSMGLEAIRAVSRAEMLEPSNPRVALMQGIGAVLTPAAFGGDLGKAETWLREALRLFEKEPRAKWPNWGRFEADLWLQHVLARRGDEAGADRYRELAQAESPSGRSLYPVKEKKKDAAGQFEAVGSLADTMMKLALAIRDGKGAAIGEFFADRARVGVLPAPGEALPGDVKWILRYRWIVAPTAGEMPRPEVAHSWETFLAHFSTLEDARLDVTEVHFDSTFQTASATLAFALVGRDREHRREWLRGSLRVKARSSRSGDWSIEEMQPEAFESRVAKTDLFSEVGREAGVSVGSASEHGAAAGDVDGDGSVDLVVPGQDHTYLYLNDGHGHFQDRTRVAGLDVVSGANAAVLVDVDDDGDLDVFFSSQNEQMLFENRLFPDGKLSFQDVSLEARVAVHTVGYSVVAGDVNGDGLPDIYVCGYNRWDQTVPNTFFGATNGTPNLLFVNQGGGRFREMAREAGVEDTRWSYDAEIVDYDGDGALDLYVVNDFSRNALYRNLIKETGTLRFRDVGAEIGLTRPGFGMGVSFGDYDNDGRLDIHATYLSSSATGYLSRLFPSSAGQQEALQMFSGNGLYHNVGNNTFRDATATAGPFLGGWAWGGGFIDVDNDGWSDIHTVNGMVSSRDRRDIMPSFIYGQLSGEQTQKGGPPAKAAAGFTNPFQSGPAPVYLERVTPVPGDAASSGAPSRPHDRKPGSAVDSPVGSDPARTKMAAAEPGQGSPPAAPGAGWLTMGGGRSFAGYERDTLFLNLGTQRFMDISGISGIDSITDGRAAVYADFDNDGDLDIFVTTLSGNLLFRNEVGQSSSFLRVTLEGTRSGRDAFGAVVRLHSSSGVQTRVKAGGEGHLSQHDPRLLFGLGADTRADWLEVTWPSGSKQRFEGLRANQSVKITEGSKGLVIVREPRSRLGDAEPAPP